MFVTHDILLPSFHQLLVLRKSRQFFSERITTTSSNIPVIKACMSTAVPMFHTKCDAGGPAVLQFYTIAYLYFLTPQRISLYKFFL